MNIITKKDIYIKLFGLEEWILNGWRLKYAKFR